MINKQLIDPQSIVVIGASNDTTKPGGKILKNIINGGYTGELYVVNPKEDEVQGIKSFRDLSLLPNVDLAILAISAKYCHVSVEILTQQKNTRAFIILSAGFSEENEAGKRLEEKIVAEIHSVNGCLIGPNCVGILTQKHHSIFTYPIPLLDPHGCDFISGSGATACFIMESGIPKGLKFANVFSVGNSAQIGVEEILAYLDDSFDPLTSSKVKLLYIETISNPQKLLKHASSLIRKGCRIAAVKAGASEAGSRAASSHTGALASSDVSVKALFDKAGIVRCYGREELIAVVSVFLHPPLTGKNIAIITHAGGPAVMLTDALSNGNMNVPHIDGDKSIELLSKLFPGSSVANPIDFLATGTAEQLAIIIDYVNAYFDNIDAMVVIFGTPGLFPVFDVYQLLHYKMRTSPKPIFPVLPSIVTAKEEIKEFISKGRINFSDEVSLGNALAKVWNTPLPAEDSLDLPSIDNVSIRKIVDAASNGYLSPEGVSSLLDAVGIPRAAESVVSSTSEAISAATEMGFPVVMKVVGPVHKSDVGGVVINVNSEEQVTKEFERMIQIKDTTAVLIQKMHKGTELFAGIKREEKFGHVIMCGLGGVFIEVLKDVSVALAPVSHPEAESMLRNLKGYKIIQGTRGMKGVNEKAFIDVIIRLSMLVSIAPEISEMDVNPLLGNPESIVAVDARINIEK